VSHFKIKFCLICCLFLLVPTQYCESSIVAINDPGFEASVSSNFWTPFGTVNSDAAAPGIDFSVEGSETLQLVGNGSATAQISGVLQDVPVDGVNINVGYEVQLSGIVGHTSNDPLAGLNEAFLEVSFVDAAGVEFMESIFQSAGIGSNSPTDVYQNDVTSVATVPANAVAVRLKALFLQDPVNGVNGSGLSGSAFFDNLEFTATVPEPSSALMLVAGCMAMLARRRRR